MVCYTNMATSMTMKATVLAHTLMSPLLCLRLSRQLTRPPTPLTNDESYVAWDDDVLVSTDSQYPGYEGDTSDNSSDSDHSDTDHTPPLECDSNSDSESMPSLNQSRKYDASNNSGTTAGIAPSTPKNPILKAHPKPRKPLGVLKLMPTSRRTLEPLPNALNPCPGG